MTDEKKPEEGLRAVREYRAESFEQAIQQHAEQDHTLIMCVYVTPDGEMQMDLDKDAETLLPDMIERLQAMCRALAN